LSAQLIDPLFEPLAALARSFRSRGELILDIGIRRRVREFSGQFGILAAVEDLDDVRLFGSARLQPGLGCSDDFSDLLLIGCAAPSIWPSR
jgi:hypothetical protein